MPHAGFARLRYWLGAFRSHRCGNGQAGPAFNHQPPIFNEPRSWRICMNVATKTGPFTLPPLPYDDGALAPTISSKTMSFHYGKHHKAYVDKLNKLVTGTLFAEMKLEDIVK